MLSVFMWRSLLPEKGQSSLLSDNFKEVSKLSFSAPHPTSCSFSLPFNNNRNRDLVTTYVNVCHKELGLNIF